jgi:hypothetical protein
MYCCLAVSLFDHVELLLVTVMLPLTIRKEAVPNPGRMGNQFEW